MFPSRSNIIEDHIGAAQSNGFIFGMSFNGPEQKLNSGDPENGGGASRKGIILAFLAGVFIAAITHLPWLLIKLGVIGGP